MHIAPAALAVALTATAAAAAAAAPMLDAPRSAAIGTPVRIAATGPEPGFFYRATLDQTAAAKSPGLACVRNIDQPFRVGHADRTYVWRGRVPTTLRCASTRTNEFVREISLRPGSYRWIVGRKVRRATWDPHTSLLVQRVRIMNAAAR